MLRPSQGEISDDKSFGKPEEVIRDFVSAGSTWIHIVDLDLAFGAGENQTLITSSVKAFPETSFQVSGGIASETSFKLAAQSGAKRLNLATQALANPDWVAGKANQENIEVCFALDVFEDRVVARGSKAEFGTLDEVLAFLANTKLKNVSVTDVSRDGMLSGPNLELLSKVSDRLELLVISSGGIATLSQLEVLVESNFCSGAILGKALYTNNFSLEAAIQVAS